MAIAAEHHAVLPGRRVHWFGQLPAVIERRWILERLDSHDRVHGRLDFAGDGGWAQHGIGNVGTVLRARHRPRRSTHSVGDSDGRYVEDVRLVI